MLRRTSLATVAAAAAAMILAACGGSTPENAAQVTITLPTAATGPTGVAPSAAAGATGVTGQPAKPQQRPDAAASAAAAPTTPPAAAPSATAPRASGEPVADSSGPTAPMVCLRRAQLRKPRKRGGGVWGANDRGSGRPVLVDGPYKTAKEAAESAESLSVVSFAEGGGLYVVSAPLRSKLGDKVSTVAKCLESRS